MPLEQHDQLIWHTGHFLGERIESNENDDDNGGNKEAEDKDHQERRDNMKDDHGSTLNWGDLNSLLSCILYSL